MKRILIVIMHLEMGGAEKSLVNLLNELNAQDAEVDLLLIKKRGVLLKQVPDWVTIVDTPYELGCLFGGPVNSIKGLVLAAVRVFGTGVTRLFKVKNQRVYYRWRKFYSGAIPCLEKQYDVAISYISGESMYYVAEKISAERKIAWIHTDLLAANAYAEEYHHYFRFFDRIVTISNECVNSICSLCSAVADKVQYLPNIVSSKYIRSSAKENVSQTSSQAFSLISIGRLEHVKGFDLAIKAAAILKNQNVDFRWNIIGDGSERKNLNDLIVRNGLENHVFLLGLKENPYPYVASSDLMVQPSRHEGKSIAVDEAKILGVPILVTNYATAKDQITPETGWIAEMSPEKIAESIIYVIENKSMYQQVKQSLKNGSYGNVEEIENYRKCFGLDQYS